MFSTAAEKVQLQVTTKGPYKSKSRATVCVICEEIIPHGEDLFLLSVHDTTFDDEYVVLLGTFYNPSLATQVCCTSCNTAPPPGAGWANRCIPSRGTRCETILSSGRRCRAEAYVKYDSTLHQDACPKHRFKTTADG